MAPAIDFFSYGLEEGGLYLTGFGITSRLFLSEIELAGPGLLLLLLTAAEKGLWRFLVTNYSTGASLTLESVGKAYDTEGVSLSLSSIFIKLLSLYLPVESYILLSFDLLLLLP